MDAASSRVGISFTAKILTAILFCAITVWPVNSKPREKSTQATLHPIPAELSNENKEPGQYTTSMEDRIKIICDKETKYKMLYTDFATNFVTERPYATPLLKVQ